MFPNFVKQYKLDSCIVGTTVSNPWPGTRRGIIYAAGKGDEAVKRIPISRQIVGEDIFLTEIFLAFAAPERNDLVWDYPRRNMFEMIYNSANRTNRVIHWFNPSYLDVKLRNKENDFAELFFRDEEALFYDKKYDLILPRRGRTTTLSKILDEIDMRPETSKRYQGFVVVAGRGKHWS